MARQTWRYRGQNYWYRSFPGDVYKRQTVGRGLKELAEKSIVYKSETSDKSYSFNTAEKLTLRMYRIPHTGTSSKGQGLGGECREAILPIRLHWHRGSCIPLAGVSECGHIRIALGLQRTQDELSLIHISPANDIYPPEKRKRRAQIFGLPFFRNEF